MDGRSGLDGLNIEGFKCSTLNTETGVLITRGLKCNLSIYIYMFVCVEN